MLLPHQDRVVVEKNMLDNKIHDLASFIASSFKFKEVSVDEQRRLVEQLEVMRRYSQILGNRIEHFNIHQP